MLLGCCHCGESVADSQSNSQSASLSESVIPTTGGCTTFCTGGVAPLRYKLVVTTTSTNLCAQSYVGTYILNLNNASGVCTWRSAELALVRIGAPGDCLEHVGCTAPNSSRWYVSPQVISGGVNIKATSHQWNGSSCVQYINLTGLQDSAATVRNCLAGCTLTGTIAGVACTGVLTVST